MKEWILIAVILIPILGGALIPLIKFSKRGYMFLYIEGVVLLNFVMIISLLLNRPTEEFILIKLVGDLTISFQLDGLACIFVALIAFLWPLATLYAFEYMKQDQHIKTFFMFYTMTFGVTVGIAIAANVLTMYSFYELLTLVTVPLVMHTLSREAVLASRKYLYYSLGGAAFAFVGIIFVIFYGGTTDFILGGVLDPGKMVGKENILLLVYVMSFLGFGVKAAVFPFNAWLPEAGVAPTPVTALLHAVAVVKSGAFAIIRITYYSFGVIFLKGTWAQTVVMIFVLITIVYGCSMAVKETHLKRRLAYSTISNLSYILFGVVIMTPLGMIGALTHLVFHAIMKICSFFCAGAVIHQSGKTYVHELNGLGRKMPKTFAIFTISALALMGVPGLCGFISKWNLAKAAVQSDNILAYIGVGALLLSALLTAIYMLSIVMRAFFPGKEFDDSSIEKVKDPSWYMMMPLGIFAAAILLFGVYSEPIVSFFTAVANGVL